MRRKRTPEQKRALQAAAVAHFLAAYGPKAQKGIEPNDRSYSRQTEAWIKRMPPADFDRLIRDDSDDP